MTYLLKLLKGELLELASELGIPAEQSHTKVEIKDLIVGQEDYDEESVQVLIDSMKLEKAEREKAERDRLERQERQQIREFELEKLRLTNAVETVSLTSSNAGNNEEIRRVNLKDLVPKFDMKNSDVTLFFEIFERQAKKEKVSEDRWVSQLIPLLPMEITELIVKESPEKGDDYQHIKALLLKRFQLSPVALRDRFEGHQRRAGTLWADLVFELRTYLDNWLKGVDVIDFEGLKELMIAEQIKKRAPIEVINHYLDEWDTFKDAAILAGKLDHYEAVRKSHKKLIIPKVWERKPFDKNKFDTQVKKGKFEVSQKKDSGKREEELKHSQATRERQYERRREIICYNCQKPGHIKPSCPLLRNRGSESLANLEDGKLINECFKPYMSKLVINGRERECLRDTGSSIDVCARSWVEEGDLLGEYVWLKQPLDEDFRCLPLAKIKIKGEKGEFFTKAAIKPDNLDNGVYLLGNRTAALMVENERGLSLINAVVTRSESRRNRKETENKTLEKNLGADSTSDENNETIEESAIELPDIREEEKSILAKISGEEFQVAQRECPELKAIWEKANSEDQKEFQVVKGKLVRMTESKRGEKITQLCIPLKFREEIKSLCHDEVGGHLGATKTKDRVLRQFFWPNVYKDLEEYVKTCDACQRVGKPQDKVKAPLKLVPIISEVFSKINIDAVGPLPLSSKNNRYLITSICLASKYPDAVPVENITSTNVINALLSIFSRTGFPRQVQSDLGKSFTSELTTEFFDRFSIKVTHSSICHPQSNCVERVHRTIKRIIKVLCIESGVDWEEILSSALFALRTVTHESTGFSPSELVMGKNLRTPQTLVFENWLGEEGSETTVVEYVLNLLNRLKRCQDLALEKMQECQVKQKLWYDRNAVTRNFEVGDQVMVLATSKQNRLDVNWIGPGTITSKISPTNYVIDVPCRRDKATIYHVNMMKPYHKRPETVNLVIEEVSEEIELDAEIPYPEKDHTHFDFLEIVRNSDLEAKLTVEQIERLRGVLEKRREVFSSNPGTTHLMEMDIELITDKPIRARPYRMSPRQIGILREEIKRLLELGVIEIGQSEYTSPIILVECPGKDPRPCIDYRKINEVTRTEFFPLPHIEELVERVSAAPYVTVMDLTKGYYQIPLTKRAQKYAAFVTPFGTYVPKKMMFGLVCAPYYFCKLMAQVLEGLQDFAVPYIDDIAVFSSTWEDHERHLGIVLDRLKGAKLTVKLAKCKFAQNCVRFLGHEIGSGTRSPSEIKIQAIKDFPRPSTKTNVRAFLGLVGYYAHYIPKYSTIAAPLTDTLKGKVKKEKIVWNEECEKSFIALKEKLISKPILYAPDYSKEFVLQADASDTGVGIVLSQKIGGEEHPILYLSKKFTRAEKNYSTIERELAAIIYGLRKLHHYLDGQRFLIETDHDPLTYLEKMKNKNARLQRWALSLQQYNFEIGHKPGKLHGNADGLSRMN